MNKKILFSLTLLAFVFFSSNVLASSNWNISVFFGEPYYRYVYPAYYYWNDLFFDPPVYRPAYYYPSYYYSTRINPPLYPSYYGYSANPTLREIGYSSSLSLPPTTYNPSYYYTSTPSYTSTSNYTSTPRCTSSQCYYN